jgi:glucose/arabinose dehydrogenase
MAQPGLALELVADGLQRLIDVQHAGDSRLFLVEQTGRIRILDDGAILATPFLNISTLVRCCGEQGLLGLAFHPNYSSNGFFYVHYSNTAGDNVVARYQVSADPNIANAGSAAILLTVAQTNTNHNGGQIRFGPDDYLYIALGDGAMGDRAQDLSTMRGKILRIDVDSGAPYAVPPDNPFIATPGARAEIWARGLRNPWRFSFDRSTGDMFIGDVGQSAWEEVNMQPAAGGGGRDYGWWQMEGDHCFFPMTGCNTAGLTRPILEYSHAVGCSIAGGFRYRGSQLTGYAGTYVYGDLCSGVIYGATIDGMSMWQASTLIDTSYTITTFGEDAAGELYVSNYSDSGQLYRFVLAAQAEMTSPAPGSIFMSPNITFNWNAGTAVDEYHLYVGSTPGGYDLYDSSQGTSTTREVMGLPTDMRPIYVTLWSKINGAFTSRGYQYTALDGRAVLMSPAPGSTLSGSGATFTWSAGTGATEYHLYIGSSPGAFDLYDASQGENLSKAFTGLPTDGRTIYVRLWSRLGRMFRARDYTYVAATIAGSAAEMSSPAMGSTLGSSATFSWTAGTGVTAYHLYVGSTPAGYDLLDAPLGMSQTRMVTGLPVDGRPIYVTLWSRINGMFSARQYSYVAAEGRAAITSPAAGSTLSSSNVTFGWSAGTNATEYYLYVGSTMGGYDLYEASQGLNLSKTVSGLPTDGRMIHVRLWTRIGGMYYVRDFTFVAATVAQSPAMLTTPVPGSVLSGPSETFGWSAGSGVTEYYLYVGSMPGGFDIYQGSQGMNMSRMVTGLPTDGRTIYVTLFSRINGLFTSRAVTYTAFSGG